MDGWNVNWHDQVVQIMYCPTTSAFHMETATGEEEADASFPLDLRHAPLLLFDHDGDDATFLFYSIPSKQVLRRRMDEMKDHRYWTTPQGWFVMAARSSPDTFLWDPFTGTRVSLPPDHEGFLRGDGPKRCLMSCKPAAAAAHPIVLVVDLAETVFWYCRLGVEIDRWLKQDYEPVDGDKTHWLWDIRSLTSVGDKFFMELRTANVVMLEFSPEEPLFTLLPLERGWAGQPPWNGTWTNKLVESRGHLFCVLFCCSDRGGRFVVQVAVFKLGLSAQAWVTVKSLDGRVFLVHPQFGASLDPQEAGLKGDCVYYCMPDDKALHVYDMERGTTSLRNPGLYLGDQCSTKVLMPTC